MARRTYVNDLVYRALSMGLTADDLIQEAELVEEEGAWLHASLIGYLPSDLREASKILREGKYDKDI